MIPKMLPNGSNSLSHDQVKAAGPRCSSELQSKRSFVLVSKKLNSKNMLVFHVVLCYGLGSVDQHSQRVCVFPGHLM